MAGRTLDPAPFMYLYNAVSDLVRDIEVCVQLGSLGQIYAEPSSRYVAPAAAPDTPPPKHPKVGPTETNESENQRKKKQAQKEGWLKKLGGGNFQKTSGLQTNVCNQHIIMGHACCHMMARGTCHYPHSSWASLSAHAKRVWSTYVSTTLGLDFVDGIVPVTARATPPGAATTLNQNTTT
eukprot:14524644-Ditylum_brightwellii.AAC.1